MDESIKTASPRLDLLERQKLSTRSLRLHVALFVLTALTTTLSGVMLAVPELAPIEPPLAS
ncbi:MAG TPA: hypothetical protein VK893_01615, partial [Pyrinomonadaceae bacterium]|nr:hypothetical protein [Pyrinomonadaceae bacterium]